MGLYICKYVSRFVVFISGYTVANFHSAGKIPCMIERFMILVNISSKTSMNFSKNLVLHGSILQVVGFTDFIVPNNYSVDTGMDLLKEA